MNTNNSIKSDHLVIAEPVTLSMDMKFDINPTAQLMENKIR